MPDADEREVEIDGRRISYGLRRSPRARRLRAEIGPRSGLRVILPAGLDESVADAFLHSRRKWVFRSLRRLARLAEILPDRPLAHGTTVPYLGTELTLDLNVGAPKVDRLGNGLNVSVPRRTRAAVRRALQAWYTAEAACELGGRAANLAERHGLRYRRIRIGNPRTRWGSCSPSGTLSFNWRLMLAPDRVATYLVAHELAHLHEPNHAPRFWSSVEKLHPTYRDEERWLKRYGAGLDL